MLVDEAKTFRELLPGERHCGDGPTAGLVRRDEDDAWPSESGEVYAQVKKRVPTISLATVYKNIHLFERRLSRGEHASLFVARGDE
jgi:Fur family transcriptional regulator, peroxide stress response regulator